MAVKRGGLGKGLDSLIPDNGKAADREKKVKVVKAITNSYQRKGLYNQCHAKATV